ncbi:UNVERIFIED_CONTAM: hypothetical protein Sindi_0478000 [Sesamum indicum]
MEPMISLEGRFMARRLGFKEVVSNCVNQIWFFWGPEVQCRVLIDHEQFLHLHLESNKWPKPFFVTAVYAKCDMVERRDLWAGLRLISVGSSPWIVGGDFNTVLCPEERSGGAAPSGIAMSDFHDMIADCALTDAGYTGSPYTWYSRRLRQRLDRVLVTDSWMDVFSKTQVTHLELSKSDHRGLLVVAETIVTQKASSFRFQHMWITHPGFLEVVRRNWQYPTIGSGMVRLQQKLTRLKHCLKEWNRTVFGNVFDRVAAAERDLKEADEAYDINPCDRTLVERSRCSAVLVRVLTQEEAFWKQKAGIKWAKDGERNTRYFHSLVQKRRFRGTIFEIQHEGEVLTDPVGIKRSAASFFEQLLSAEPAFPDEMDRDCLEDGLTDEDRCFLCTMPTMAEVREAVFCIEPESVAGPDGFGAIFYHTCWDLVSEDVFCAVSEFFRGIAMPKSFTATTISLIPKTASPVSWSEYRPISLCNVTNKICTKLMSIRLGHVLPKVLSPSQSGFVPGRLLSDNVLLAQELVHSLESRRSEANVIFKLDMAKAYDRVNWEFLFQVLRLKGFPQHWINLVANAVSNCWFSVLVNGEHAGFFHSTRGLRQGDPLSPALFVLAADYLSQGLNTLFVAHPTMYYQSPGRVRVSHLAYADDMMIFTNICRQHMELLRDFLHAYERVSGQRINSAKSSFILSRQVPLSQLQEVQYVMGYQLKYLPVTYLGVPLYKGNRKACLFDSLISRIRDMLQGWAMTNLSHGGRLALIRSVLQAMPLHLLQVIHPPKSVLITIERIFNGFFWGSYNGRRHIHWCSWDKICRPVAEGGLGIRSLAEYVRAFSMKLWWRFRLKSSLWSEYLHDRYCRALHPTHVPYNRNHSSVWHRLCRIRDVAEPLIFWTLGQGAVSFWHDNWFGEKPLAQLVRGAPDTMEPVCYYWHEGEWNVPKIFRIVPPQIAHIICRIPIAAGQRDRIVWTATSNGTFSTASAWEAIRVASPRRQLFTDIWHRSLRPTVSVFLWRLFQDWIPVDERMKRKGFSFASKCQCCEAEESISHLFVEGEVVREVWLHFANVFGLQLCETGDLVNLVHFWRYSTPFHSDLHICTLVPFLILWSTWTQRNAAKYHGAHFTATGTILEVQRHLRTLYAARIMTSIQWKGDLHRALAMGFCFRPIAPQAPRVVRWSTPSPAWFKLNSDGSSLGNPGPAAAAGIIRDADGQVRLAYQFALGTATSVVSELTAVWRGLELARAHSLAPIVVEVDATVVLQLLQSRASGIWEVQHLIMRIVQLQQELGSDVRHIFREANGAADHLAKDAASRQLTRVMYQEDITGVLRGIIRLDKMGTPYLRRNLLLENMKSCYKIGGHEILVAGVAGRENRCKTLGLSFLEDHKPWGTKGSRIFTANPGVFPKEARKTLPIIARRDFSQKILILNKEIREAKIMVEGAFRSP